ncbi:hypothetical protein V1477_001472 [Vespula maculifrons]|uniref:Uncharacterized protein n=1 Tax=Vespula maculifrons TaxID=7453 RepID=A0ABD2CYV7_VESMC
MLGEGEENFALLVIRHLMCQMVKTAEEADAAYEFITNLADNLKLKLVREEANYLVYATHWIMNAEEWFKKQLEILTKEETSLAIVHVCVI